MEKQKLKERKINSKSHIALHTSHNSGITLVALIITIIVLLILAVVAIRAVQGDGIIQYAKDASVKTKISQIQEELELKKGELLAENLGEKLPYNLSLDDLKISEDLKNEYGTKLKIGTDGKLYYDPNEVTSEAEQEQLKELGISEYQEEPSGKTYTFTIEEIVPKGTWSDIGLIVPIESLGEGKNVLENSGTPHPFISSFMTYNVTCSDSTIPNMSSEDPENPSNRGYTLWRMEENIILNIVFNQVEGSGTPNHLDETNWESYKTLTFTITK